MVGPYPRDAEDRPGGVSWAPSASWGFGRSSMPAGRQRVSAATGCIPRWPRPWRRRPRATSRWTSSRSRRAPSSPTATGAEAGFVSAGASSGLTLAAAAVLAGVDPVRIDRLPDTDGMPNEILVQAGHRNAYDHALRAAGARLVDVGTQGYPGGGRTHPWQIEAAIGPRTVGHRASLPARAGDRAAAGGRRDRPPPRSRRDRGRRRGPAAEGQPAPLHRRGRGPRRVFRRQDDRRAAGERHPVRSGRSDPRGGAPAAGHGRRPSARGATAR